MRRVPFPDFWSVLLIATATLVPATIAARAQTPSNSSRGELAKLRESLAAALREKDEATILRVAKEAIEVLGESAGAPEVADVYTPIPSDAKALSKDEADRGFARVLPFVRSKKWWKIGLDPTQTEHLPREAADVLSACVAGVRAGAGNREELLAEAKEAADYLLWTQGQAGTGVFPFPAFRGGQGAAFAAADRFLEGAERAGKLDDVVSAGWAFDDLHDGGLQFDNGRCGCALLDLYELDPDEIDRDERYCDGALRAADWAIDRPLVPNWNYNSFSVELLARAYRVKGDEKYLAAAKEKALLGVIPGQLVEGERAGRWADPHNARPAYHYIMLKALAELAAVLPADDSDRDAVIAALRRGLVARNVEVLERGAMTSDSAIRCLVRVAQLDEATRGELQAGRSDETLAGFERLVAEELRGGRPSSGPVGTALMLERGMARDE